jgi:hypothetical protein
MVKPGYYQARVKTYGIPEVKDGKHPQVAITFEFMEGNTPRELTYYGSLSPRAAQYTIDNVIRAGLKSDDLSTMCDENAFESKEVQITVTNEEYDGKMRSKITWINELGGAKFKAICKEQAAPMLKNYSALVKAGRMEMAQKQGQKPKAQNAHTEPEIPSDEEFWGTEK